MTKLIIELEEGLSNMQVARIKDLLSMIRGVAGVEGGGNNYPQENMNHYPPPNQAQQPQQRQQQGVDFENINPAQKKHIISQAITWGSVNGKITFEQLERLNPDELLSKAIELLSYMTDEEKNIVFSELKP